MNQTQPKNVRLTITVTPEVHQVFHRFAKAASIPVGRAMGEWLGDTIDAAAFTAQKMEEARAAPALVARELHGYALGLADEAGQVIKKMQAGQAAKAAAGALGGAVGDAVRPGGFPIPPSSNTGGKGPKTTQKKAPRS